MFITAVLKHQRDDPNAPAHVAVGAAVALSNALNYIMDAQYGLAALALLFGGLLANIALELVQRLTGGRNTWQESVLDALGGGCWFLYPFRRRI